MNDRSREADEPRAITVLERYLTLRAKAAEIQEQIDAMKPEIVAIVMDEPGGKLPDVLGCDFRIQERKTWKYSEATTNQAKILAQVKKLEETSGTAELQGVSGSVVVTAARPS